jgi:hypothetical protein
VPKIPLPLPVLVVSRLKLHRAGRERRAGAKIMPAVRKALEKLVVPSGSATSIARAYLRDVPPVLMNAAFGFAHGYLLRQS